MRVVIGVVLLTLFLVSCSPTTQAPEPTVPTDAQLSQCQTDADCIPLPSQCHPTRCVNKAYEDSFEKPEFCTEIFLEDAAYTSDDCACENSVCINKNEIIIPDGATKCSFRGEVCDMKNQTVCGWFKPTVQCIRAPCAVTVSNPCEACNNHDIAYWTNGPCE